MGSVGSGPPGYVDFTIIHADWSIRDQLTITQVSS